MGRRPLGRFRQRLRRRLHRLRLTGPVPWRGRPRKCQLAARQPVLLLVLQQAVWLVRHVAACICPCRPSLRLHSQPVPALLGRRYPRGGPNLGRLEQQRILWDQPRRHRIRSFERHPPHRTAHNKPQVRIYNTVVPLWLEHARLAGHPKSRLASRARPIPARSYLSQNTRKYLE